MDVVKLDTDENSIGNSTSSGVSSGIVMVIEWCTSQIFIGCDEYVRSKILEFNYYVKSKEI